MTSNLAAGGRWLRSRAEKFSVALLTVMFASFIAQIFWRYVLNQPLSWTEEVIITTWLWTVLWGAAFVLRDRDEIRFDILYSNVPPKVRRLLTFLTSAAAAMLYAISLPAAYSYVSFMKVERSAALHIPINVLYSVYLIFAVASIVRFIWLGYGAATGRATLPSGPDNPEAVV